VPLTVVTVVAAVAFVLVERRSSEPVLPLSLFARPNLRLTTVVTFVVGVISFGTITFVPLFQQTVQGASPSGSGTLLLPMTLAVVVASQVAGRVTSRTGRYRRFPVIGAAAMAAGCAVHATAHAGTPVWLTSGALVLVGTGLGLATQVVMLIAQNTVPAAEIGVATATTTMFRTIGGAVGTSVFGALLATGGAGPAAVVTGMSRIFTVAAVVAAVAAVTAWRIRELPLGDR
jgi:predicted MFS family arabinose efflux permease